MSFADWLGALLLPASVEMRQFGGVSGAVSGLLASCVSTVGHGSKCPVEAVCRSIQLPSREVVIEFMTGTKSDSEGGVLGPGSRSACA